MPGDGEVAVCAARLAARELSGDVGVDAEYAGRPAMCFAFGGEMGFFGS